MGWWDSIFGSRSTDPLEKLDPKLREFLRKEAPVKPDWPRESPTTPAVASQEAEDDGPKVPAASQFPDGRYAHLWRTYRPLAEIEWEAKSDSEKIHDVVQSYKERKRMIANAALENCSILQGKWMDCLSDGTWLDRLQACRRQMQLFERCYSVNSKALKALNYRVDVDQTDAEAEHIQMRSDGIFNQLLEHEKESAAAKKAGLTIPDFNPELPRQLEKDAIPSDRTLKHWARMLSKVPEGERPVVQAEMYADLQARLNITRGAEKVWEVTEEERIKKVQAGEGTVLDKLAIKFGTKRV